MVICLIFIVFVQNYKTQKGEIELKPPHLLYQQNLTTIILIQ